MTKILKSMMAILLILALCGIISNSFAQVSLTNELTMQQGRSGLGVAVVDGQIYAIGGASANGFSSYNEQYDPAKDTWTIKSPMPTARSAFAIASVGKCVYCIGGYVKPTINQETATSANEMYDPATDSWITKAPMPTPELGVEANVVNGRIYIIGGSNNSTINQVYDPAVDSWTTKTSVPNPAPIYSTAVVGDNIYVFTSTSTQIYNVDNDNWSIGSPSPTPLVVATAAVTAGVFAPARIYIFGVEGQTPYWQLSNKGFVTQCYDPSTDTWTNVSRMQTGRCDIGIGVVDDYLYLIGGFSYHFSSTNFDLNPIYTYSTAVERYKPVGYGTIPPRISIISPQPITYNAGNISLSYITNKAVVWQAYSLDGQPEVTITSNTTLTALPSGNHSIKVFAMDSFGNNATKTAIFTMKAITDNSKVTLTGLTVVIAIISVAVWGWVYYRKHG